MSGTPIFEQLCRDYVEAGNAEPVDVTQSPAASQPTVPELFPPVAGGALAYKLDDHLPLALGELTCPAD